MEPAAKIDIKSEIYRAVVPYITRYSKMAWTRFREVPKLDVFKSFLVLYLAVGFILEGIAASLPAMVLSFIGISAHTVGATIFLFWPGITFALISEEHAVFCVVILFIGAVYISHLKQKIVDTRVELQGVQPQPAVNRTSTQGLIDVTPAPSMTMPTARPVEAEILLPER